MERAIIQLKNRKSEGVDNIPPEGIKAMDNISFNSLHHLINRIWNEEQTPDDWRNGLLVKLPKEGVLSLCNNWRGITLLSIPSKIICSVILQRIKTEVDKTLRDEQAGFRLSAFLCRPDGHSQNNCRANSRMANFPLHEFYRF